MGLIHCRRQAGKGRAIVLLFAKDEKTNGIRRTLLEDLSGQLSEAGTVHLLEIERLSHQSVDQATTELLSYLTEHRVRQASFLAFGVASLLLWKIGISHQRLIRNALVINGLTRPQAGWFEALLQRLESHLPLGLPFRVNEGSFYALPFLERFRFPVIVVSWRIQDNFLESEAEAMAKALPVAWSMNVEERNPITRFVQAFKVLKEIPSKRPQKRRQLLAASGH